MTKNTIAIGLTLGLTWSLLTLGALPASAEKASPLHSGPNCLSQIQLPQDKEELGLSDVKHAVENHLLRIGAIGHDVWVSWFDEDEDVIAVEISFDGNLRRQIKVDGKSVV